MVQGRNVREVIQSLRAIEGLEVELVATATGTHTATPAKIPGNPTVGWLPKAVLFEPLIADPRWPYFSGRIQFYQNDDELGTVAAPNFGATLPLYGWRALGVDWQLGLHAGTKAFTIFSLTSAKPLLVTSVTSS